ncbi:MAG: hypothetical protein LDL24_06925 [Treponema sp.]|nr:hypothetical protein [Treponema sp.]
MKKLIASLLVLFLGASMVMAEVSASGAESQQAVAVSTADFADVEGVEIGELESGEVRGGKLPDREGSVMYGSGVKKEVMNADYVPTKSQVKESINEIKKITPAATDVAVAAIGLYSISHPVPRVILYTAGAYSLGRALQQCSTY